MPDATTGGQSGQTEGSTTGTSEKQQPTEAYKGLQRDLNKANEALKAQKALVAQLKGTPSADEEVASLRQETSDLRRELEVTRLKAGNPDIADIIELFASRTNSVPDEEALGLFRDRLGSRTPEAAAPVSSGIRNNSIRRAETEDDVARRILTNSKLWD